jgi:transformation/transcription domain-associated protein
LEHPEGGPLREMVIKNIGILISGDMEAVQDSWFTAVINTVHIMHSLCKFKGTDEWMDAKDIIIWFKMVGKNLEAYQRANTLSLELRLAAEQASEQLMVVFTKFLEHHPTDLDTLFQPCAWAPLFKEASFYNPFLFFPFLFSFISCIYYRIRRRQLNLY